MKRIKRVNFNTVQYVKRFDKTLPSNQLCETLTEPIMTIIKKPPSTPPSPVTKVTNDIKDMAIVKKSPPQQKVRATKSPPSKKKSPTKAPPTPTTKSSPAKTNTPKKGQSKKSPSSKKSPIKTKRT